jgi:ppGpp synthetase/RelA/SpoT-type nucleotidyltranferase
MASLVEVYEERYARQLAPVAAALEAHLLALTRGQPRIDRVTARAKTPESFMGKAVKLEDGKPKYGDPLTEIQDQIAARIITFYLADVERIEALISTYFGSIESRRVEPESSSEFGYEGHHFILLTPEEAFPRPLSRRDGPSLFELQIKTVFQHAWSAAGHDLLYKAPAQLSREQSRRGAFTAAQAWGADHIFDELSKELLSGDPPN